MSPIVAASQSVPADAIELIDDEENEVIMMDPKNYYMVYLLKTSAFLHSCVAFLMMISYYKLKVKNVIFIYINIYSFRFRWLYLNVKKK
jgi:hypothetical protein